MSKPLKGFITYSHKDKKSKNKLLTCLEPMKREGLIDPWHDNEIIPGDKWREEIFSTNLPNADIWLYLVSSNSLASETCNKELALALQKNIIPILIILEDCDWKNYKLSNIQACSDESLPLNEWESQKLSDFQALPVESKPINEWNPRSKAWQSVVIGIRETVYKIQLQTDAEIAFKQGNFLLTLKQIENAQESYSRAIKLDPCYSVAYNNRAITYTIKGDFALANKDYATATKLKPNYVEAYNNRGNTYIITGEYDKAIEDYKKVIELTPDDAKAYNNRGATYGRIKEFKKAIEDFTTAINLDSSYASAYNNRGLVLYENEVDKAIEDYDTAIELNPNFTNAYINRGVAFHNKGKYGLAIKDYNKAIKLNPDQVLVYNKRGLSYNQNGQPDRAIEDYNEVIKRNPKFAEAYFNRGAAFGNKGEIDLVIKDSSKAIELKPDHTGAYKNRGLAYYKKGEVDHAIDDFSKVILLAPNDVETYCLQGATYYNIGKVDLAIKDYSKAIELKPDYVEAYKNRGIIYGEKDQLDKAINDFNVGIKLNGKNADLFLNRGTAYGKKDQLDKAINDFNKAIELKPDYALTYCNRGNAYDKKDEIDKAIKDYDTAIELKPDYAEALQYRGIAYIAKGELDNAIKDFETAIELNPKDADAHNNRGSAYQKKGLIDLALQDLCKAIELNPKSSVFYYNRGNAYGEKDEVDKAIADYTKAIELQPDYADAYYNRGFAFSTKNEHDQAIENYNIAESLNLKDARVYNNRGVVYYKKGEINSAIVDYTKSIELDPEDAISYYNRGEARLHKGKWEKAKDDLVTSKRKGGDIIASFRNEHKNVETFEKRYGIKLPEDISLLLTQRRRTRYPNTRTMFDAAGNPFQSPNVVNLLEQIRNVSGITLNKYVNTKPSFGISTTPTEVFVIDEITRDRLVASHPSSADILKPFLHGKDLRRWYVDTPHHWLILTYRGIVINDFPSILKYLENFIDSLSKRKGKQEWYELPVSLDDSDRFTQPKLVSPSSYNHQSFAVDSVGYYYGNTSYIVPTEQTWLCGLLNSRSVEWFYSQVSNQLTIDHLRARSGYIQQIPIPNITSEQKTLIAKIVDYLIYLQQQPTINSKNLEHARDRIMLGYFERIIESLVYELYLTEDLHKGDKHFFQPLLEEQLPSHAEIEGDVMTTLRDIFELLYDKTHLVRRNLFYLDSVKAVRIIEDKI